MLTYKDLEHAGYRISSLLQIKNCSIKQGGNLLFQDQLGFQIRAAVITEYDPMQLSLAVIRKPADHIDILT